MGRQEFLVALQREADEAVAAIDARTAAEEVRLRQETDERLVTLRGQQLQQQGALCGSVRQTLLAAASREASLTRLRAEHALTQRLRERSRVCLGRIGVADPERLFRQLAAELPEGDWQQVRVAAADVSRAAALFPAAIIVTDDSLVGGLVATAADGSLVVDNSLATRLTKLWPELLPKLMSALRSGSGLQQSEEGDGV